MARTGLGSPYSFNTISCGDARTNEATILNGLRDSLLHYQKQGIELIRQESSFMAAYDSGSAITSVGINLPEYQGMPIRPAVGFSVFDHFNFVLNQSGTISKIHRFELPSFAIQNKVSGDKVLFQIRFRLDKLLWEGTATNTFPWRGRVKATLRVGGNEQILFGARVNDAAVPSNGAWETAYTVTDFRYSDFVANVDVALNTNIAAPSGSTVDAELQIDYYGFGGQEAANDKLLLDNLQFDTTNAPPSYLGVESYWLKVYNPGI